ncbi:hypothetical protein [Chroococcidiopsis sp.]|uniref:hypothetical protein n=1 Tax=Chroococcidiopsis sp. TaxID=3088168 RepID=UPI003F35FEBB
MRSEGKKTRGTRESALENSSSVLPHFPHFPHPTPYTLHPFFCPPTPPTLPTPYTPSFPRSSPLTKAKVIVNFPHLGSLRWGIFRSEPCVTIVNSLEQTISCQKLFIIDCL